MTWQGQPSVTDKKEYCDHAIALVLRGTDPVGINFNYCPKCGEKL